MSDEKARSFKDQSSQDIVDDDDDDDDVPPCYSPPAYSIASLSEVSVVETLDIAAEDDSRQTSILFEGLRTPFYSSFYTVSDIIGLAIEDEKSHLDTGLGPRTSAFIQTFMRPNAQPSLVNVKRGPTAPQGGGNVQEVPTDLQSVSLDIVVMVVGGKN